MLEVVISFLVAVTAGVVCHYIIKWLDSDDNDNPHADNSIIFDMLGRFLVGARSQLKN